VDQQPGTRSTDVIVLGGGIVGVAAAAHLAETGRRVVVVERDAIGAGASGRNSGVVQHPFDPILVELHLETLGLYRALANDHFRLPDRPAGLLNVTHDAEGAARLTEALRRSYPGLQPTYLAPGEAAALEPALAPGVAACRLEIGYPVGPLAATQAYARLAERRGVQIRLGSAARLRIERGTAVGAVLEDGGRIDAAEVVVATGPWTPRLIDPTGSWRPIRPLWGVVATIELERPPHHVLEEAEVGIEPGAETATDDPGLAFSLMTADGASSLGSTFLDDEPDAAALVPALIARGARFVPEVGRAPRRGHRQCARPLSADGRPLIGRVPWIAGLWVAAGHGPWGISTGPASGRLLADLIAGTLASPPPAVDPARFGTPARPGSAPGYPVRP
jgi:glycine/D-amino acid oxidase-like deaminating enzyme